MCSGRASFAPDGDFKALRCARHKIDGDLNVAKTLCKCGSGIKPIFGTSGSKTATACSKCRTDGDVDIRNAQCKLCTTHQASTYVPGENPRVATICLTCAREHQFGTKNIKAPQCECGTSAHFGLRGQRPRDARFCGKCRDHMDIVHPKCPVCNDTRGQTHMRGHCLRCFIHTFPDERVVRNYQTKERAVRAFLTNTFASSYTLVFDRAVDRVVSGREDGVPCRSSGRRPDVLIDMGEWVVVVEIDEFQHDFDVYSCETKREMQIFDDAGRRPMVFIRFNPDSYKAADGRTIPTPWTVDRRCPSGVLHVSAKHAEAWRGRLDALETEIRRAASERPTKEFTRVLLFFNES